MHQSDRALLDAAGAELATFLEMTYPVSSMALSSPEAVAVMAEICWRLEELGETPAAEITDLVSAMAYVENHIANLRKERGMSLESLGNASGLGTERVRWIEHRVTIPEPKDVQLISDALGQTKERVFPLLVGWRR